MRVNLSLIIVLIGQSISFYASPYMEYHGSLLMFGAFIVGWIMSFYPVLCYYNHHKEYKGGEYLVLDGYKIKTLDVKISAEERALGALIIPYSILSPALLMLLNIN